MMSTYQWRSRTAEVDSMGKARPRARALRFQLLSAASPGIRTSFVRQVTKSLPIQPVTMRLSLSTMTRYNINALYLREIVPPRAIREAMPTMSPADPVVEEDGVCPECGRGPLVRDYPRAALVGGCGGLVIS